MIKSIKFLSASIIMGFDSYFVTQYTTSLFA